MSLVLSSSHFDEWSLLSDEDRKLRAARAVSGRDEDELWSLTDAYLHRRPDSISVRSLKNYRVGVLKLLDAWGDVNLLRPSEDRAVHYLRSLAMDKKDLDSGVVIQKALSVSSLRIRQISAKHFYDALIWAKVFNELNPFEGLKLPADKVAPEDKRKAYTLEEAVKLFQQALIEYKLEQDSAYMVVFLLACNVGLRLDEIRNLKWSNLDYGHSYPRVYVHGKGKKDRRVALASGVVKFLRHVHRPAEVFVLQNILRGKVTAFSDTTLRKKMFELCQKAAVRDYKAVHSLRHTFAYQLQAAISLRDMAKLLGHSNKETTSIYATPSDEDSVRSALGLTSQLDPMHKFLYSKRDEGVNSLMDTFIEFLNPSLRSFWDSL